MFPCHGDNPVEMYPVDGLGSQILSNPFLSPFCRVMMASGLPFQSMFADQL